MIKRISILLLLVPLSFSSKAQNKVQLEQYIHVFLVGHKPSQIVDTSISSGNYHYYPLGNMTFKKKISTYIFSWNITDVSRNYLLIIDHKHNKWDVYGQNNLSTDLLALEGFFDKNKCVRKTNILLCYRYLIDNYYPTFGNWSTKRTELNK